MDSTFHQTSGSEELGPTPMARARGMVVLGVDGSPRNRAAVGWAAREARQSDMGLMVVAVLPRGDVMPPLAPAWVQERALVRAAMVEEQARRRTRPPRRVFRLALGSPGPELAHAARPGDLVVVGKRGAGTLERIRVGSTSLSAATFVRVPLAVVPHTWQDAGAGPAEDHGHVVVGVDGSGRRGKDGPALDFAFSRTARQGADLLVFSGWELPPMHGWSSRDTADWSREREARLQELLRPWTDRYPQVRVGVRAETTAPTRGLLEAARGARLIVVGRGTRRGPLERLSLGGTARRVLQEATCPVVVAPLVPATFSPEDALNHNAQEFVA